MALRERRERETLSSDPEVGVHITGRPKVACQRPRIVGARQPTQDRGSVGWRLAILDNTGDRVGLAGGEIAQQAFGKLHLWQRDVLLHEHDAGGTEGRRCCGCGWTHTGVEQDPSGFGATARATGPFVAAQTTRLATFQHQPGEASGMDRPRWSLATSGGQGFEHPACEDHWSAPGAGPVGYELKSPQGLQAYAVQSRR